VGAEVDNYGQVFRKKPKQEIELSLDLSGPEAYRSDVDGSPKWQARMRER
jgi:hypothetical protein